MVKGLLVTIEGIHGSGKSTIAQMLFEKMKSQRLNVIFTYDQIGTDLGGKIREINLKEEFKIDKLTEALLIAAARRQNISEIIIPNLLKGKIIICERYNDAYFAFQGFARGIPFQFLECISLFISEGINPDLTILLDLDAKLALSRINSNLMHRIEKEPLRFHEKVREGYKDQVKKYPDRIKLIDASLSIDKVFVQSWEKIKKLFILKGIIKC